MLDREWIATRQRHYCRRAWRQPFRRLERRRRASRVGAVEPLRWLSGVQSESFADYYGVREAAQ